MEQNVIHQLINLGLTRQDAKNTIRKAETFYGWKLRPGNVDIATGWVLEGAQMFHVSNMTLPTNIPDSKIEQTRQDLIKFVHENLDVSKTHAKYMVKFVEDRFGKLKSDKKDDAINYFLTRYNRNDFENEAATNPDYYQFWMQMHAPNPSKSAKQNQLQTLDQQKYSDYLSRKGPEKIKECPICQEEFEPGDDIVQLTCHHIFHKDCIKKWLKINKTCPICKVQVFSQK